MSEGFLNGLFSFFQNLLGGSKKSAYYGDGVVAPRLDEYSTLLSVFDLDDDATPSEIKKAYRIKMKELHPDSNIEGSKEEFEKVQAAYERLMELQKGWFGLGKD